MSIIHASEIEGEPAETPAEVLAEFAATQDHEVPEVQADESSVLDRLERRRAETRVRDARLVVPIPSWGGDVVGEFTLLTKDERTRLDRATSVTPHGMDKETKATRDLCLMVGAHCRSLTFQGETVPGDTRASGFTAEFGERIGARPFAEGHEVTYADVVWEALDRHAPSAIAMARLLVKWTQDPSSADYTEPGAGDPFGVS